MNFLAHLLLAGDNEDLRLGALLGDFVRGRSALQPLGPELARGILLHRHIDAFTDAMPGVAALRGNFPPRFRRFAGIILDLSFDHELARRWSDYSARPLESFDREVRQMLESRREQVPEGLARFMAYADRRGLFAAYREQEEILHSLAGIGRRLSRPNPLHDLDEDWERLHAPVEAAFEAIFATVQSEVADWLNSKSTTTGS